MTNPAHRTLAWFEVATHHPDIPAFAVRCALRSSSLERSRWER